jgi:pyruvate dehydrogenase E2 component (dihydrolipoamide acetyltransferase)
MTEGSIAHWLKQEGEAIKTGEPLVEVETDKAVVEVESQHDGILGRILVEDGTSGIQVGTVIALLAIDGEDPRALTMTNVTVQAVNDKEASITVSAPIPRSTHLNHGRIMASPLARRIARTRNIELANLSGSGPGGRILKADVEAALRIASVPALASTADAGVTNDAGYEDIPHTNIRRIIAQRLTEAKQSVPHFYLTVDCNVDALMKLRSQVEGQASDIKASVNDFIVKAAALALKRVPALNTSWGNDAVRRYKKVDISVAVATPGGLVTPIVRNADEKSLRQISAEIRQLAARAREGRLRPDEFQGGSFTISNLGMFGIREFAAIINPPQACILAVGASEQRAVVRDGALAIATQMTCTLSADHRVVDGAIAAEFLAAFRSIIETPLLMLI